MTAAPGLLADLGPEERRAVLARMHRRTFAAGEIVCHEGDLADTVHFVVEGRVVAWRTSDSGDVHAYAVMGPGQTFGELAMIRRDGRRTATVEAIEHTVTMTLSYVEFERLCGEHPEVNRLLLRLLAARVTRLTEALMEALHQPAEQRVVRRLAGLCDVYSSRPPATPRSPGSPSSHDAVPVLVPLNQTDLAELAGVTRPTANRVLRRLEAEGVVELLRGRISVRDVDALRRTAGHARGLRHG